MTGYINLRKEVCLKGDKSLWRVINRAMTAAQRRPELSSRKKPIMTQTSSTNNKLNNWLP